MIYRLFSAFATFMISFCSFPLLPHNDCHYSLSRYSLLIKPNNCNLSLLALARLFLLKFLEAKFVLSWFQKVQGSWLSGCWLVNVMLVQ